MADFIPAAPGDWYGQLLNSAQQQLVKLPDGTYVQVPQMGQATSLDDIYRGIIPSVPGPLKSRAVNTVPIDPMTGNPITAKAPGFTADTMAATRAEQSGSRPAVTVGTQPAGTVAMPPGARPESVNRAFAQMGVTPPGNVWDPFGTNVAGKDQSRLPSNDGGESGFMSAFFPGAGTPATAAIDQAAGGGIPLPRPRPLPPASLPLTSFAPPSVPAPSYTIKSGDTLSALAKKFGTTVGQLANANNISDPNRIRAGSTLNLGFMAPPVPRMPPPSHYAAPQQQQRAPATTAGEAANDFMKSIFGSM